MRNLILKFPLQPKLQVLVDGVVHRRLHRRLQFLQLRSRSVVHYFHLAPHFHGIHHDYFHPLDLYIHHSHFCYLVSVSILSLTTPSTSRRRSLFLAPLLQTIALHTACHDPVDERLVARARWLSLSADPQLFCAETPLLIHPPH
jgi:hypothetical protein